MQVDIRTVTVLGMAAAMLFSALSLVVARSRNTCPGFGLWTAADLCASFALLLLAMGGFLPYRVSLPLGNMLAIATCVFAVEGTRRFRGNLSPWWTGRLGAAVTLVLICYYGLVVFNLNRRMILLSVFMGVSFLLAAKYLAEGLRPGQRLSLGFTAAALGLTGLVQLARAAYAVFLPPIYSYFAPSPLLAALTVATVLGFLAWIFGFVLMNHDYLVAHLLEAQARAAHADAAKSEFLADVSHEIRTPMSGVIGLTELLLETPLNRTQRDYVETMKESGLALLSIVNELLDLSKIEAGKVELEEVSFDPREVVEKTVEMLSWKASARRLKLTCGMETDVPRALVGDPGRLRQILTNLAANGLQFTNHGGVHIQVALDQTPATLKFSVTDTGPGIPLAQQNILFERFKQLKAHQGSGLGLAIAKELAERMGGEIGLLSDEGKGSTFWFTASFKKQNSFERTPVRVRVVDDSVVNQKVATDCSKKSAVKRASAPTAAPPSTLCPRASPSR